VSLCRAPPVVAVPVVGGASAGTARLESPLLSDIDERLLGALTIRIDRHLCVGFGDCIDVAPEAFDLDDDGIAVFRDTASSVDHDCLVEACRVCPVDAITAHDHTGKQIAP